MDTRRNGSTKEVQTRYKKTLKVSKNDWCLDHTYAYKSGSVMPIYCVNREEDEDGDHEVHKTSCQPCLLIEWT